MWAFYVKYFEKYACNTDETFQNGSPQTCKRINTNFSKFGSKILKLIDFDKIGILLIFPVKMPQNTYFVKFRKLQ